MGDRIRLEEEKDDQINQFINVPSGSLSRMNIIPNISTPILIISLMLCYCYTMPTMIMCILVQFRIYVCDSLRMISMNVVRTCVC